ncbi:hypothetical protein IJ579_00490 [bacterium]|nr:hypothetical protein [bacterium]
MKKRFWKIEYSITTIVIFAIVLLLTPTSMFITSKEAAYIAKWNETYAKADYAFSAMLAQANSDLVKGLKSAKTEEEKEMYMMELIKPYLRLKEHEYLFRRYTQHYMDGRKVRKHDKYYFENLYTADNGHIVGIKDIPNEDENQSGFIMMFDMNGIIGPNTWGKDIFGLNIYPNMGIKAIGHNWTMDDLKRDCSAQGTGISCSHYYRIGGEFNE